MDLLALLIFGIGTALASFRVLFIPTSAVNFTSAVGVAVVGLVLIWQGVRVVHFQSTLWLAAAMMVLVGFVFIFTGIMRVLRKPKETS